MNLALCNLFLRCNICYSKGEVYILTEEDKIIIHTHLLYDISQSKVTDEVYDQLYALAKQQYPNDDFFNTLTSINSGYGKEIQHTIPMGSMEELKLGDWDKWKIGCSKYIISDKLDGCSLVLTYKNGNLNTAATRGQGYKGKDVLRHIRFISNIPHKINYKQDLIVRGELLLPRSEIASVLNKLNQLTGIQQKNGRNTIAGALNKKETNHTVFEKAHFVTYWTSKYFGNSFEFLKELNFEIPNVQYLTDASTISDDNLIQIVKERLNDSVYELDGIILTQLENVKIGFETGTINPKASRKFKQGIYNNTAESIVTNINWQISRYGIFTPVIEIEPREISGCIVTNITGHNYANIISKHCGIGATIKFCRAGLVIPHLQEVLIESDNFNLPNISTRIDGLELVLNDYSQNEYTEEINIQKLVYLGKKLDIEQLGYGNCKKLYAACEQNNILLTPISIFNLPDSFIIDTIGENGKKIVSSLKSKKFTLSEVKFAAAIGDFGNGIGETILNQVYQKYNTLDVTESQLNTMDNFGEIRKKQYINNLVYWIGSRKTLVQHGVKFLEKTLMNSNSTTLCFSGIRDKNFENHLIKNGNMISNTLTKKVNLLIVKDLNANSSKILKAHQAGIKIMTIDEAYSFFAF